MTEEGMNVVKEFTALKENENKINNNQIELDNYFKYSGEQEKTNKTVLKEIEFQKKRKSVSILYVREIYKRKYVSNPKRVKAKLKK
tara:strand:- start:1203 stop:1460 length:258 start_codon:yes stop_codon:yes gene_type:complete